MRWSRSLLGAALLALLCQFIPAVMAAPLPGTVTNRAPNLLRNVGVKAQIEKLDARTDC
jgi:hypothetical protein